MRQNNPHPFHPLAGKQAVVEEFVRRLRRSSVGQWVGKVVLFGSVVRGEAGPGSDVDVLVVATAEPRRVQRVSSDIAFDLALETQEGIEPIVHCLHDWRLPHNLFLDTAKAQGREVFSMDDSELRKVESEGYLALAQHYWTGAQRNFAAGDFRLTVDAAYNAASRMGPAAQSCLGFEEPGLLRVRCAYF